MEGEGRGGKAEGEGGGGRRGEGGGGRAGTGGTCMEYKMRDMAELMIMERNQEGKRQE